MTALTKASALLRWTASALMAIAPGSRVLTRAADGMPILECRWAHEPITIDGKADEPAWKQAQVIQNFAMPWLGTGDHGAPTQTRARLLWDQEFLYFYAEMEDSDVYADITEQNGQTWDNDVFELFFKPATN